MKKPYRYEKAGWADVPLPLQKLTEVSRETRRGAYIHGAVGSGKTHAAYAIAEHVEQVMKAPVLFWNTTELFAAMKDDFDKRRQYAEYETTISKLLQFTGLLFLDDIGSEKPSEWVAEQLYLLVNRRYERGFVTFFTSNLAIAELSEKLGDRTASRIAEMCDIYPLTGADRRIAAAKARK